MTEETLFAEAIEKNTPAERTAFLDAACRGDAGLRERVEALLQSHAGEDFLKTPAIQRAAEVAGGRPSAGATEAEVPGDDPESALDFLASSEKPDCLGRVGHYEVQEIIGRGGMGVVLRAFDEKLHRVVAIKVMAAQLATNAIARKRFTREAQAQAAVSHDHIVTIHAVEEANGLPYLVMQYVSGMSLQQRLEKSGPLQLHEILRIGMQTASALAAAHAQGLVHRDIKPANILLENGVERVKITDFGLARAATEASLTQSGVVTGTPQYMSPEQAQGEAIDQRTDLFSLGSVLYAMCTGRAPFRASGTMAILKRVCEETPTPIRDTNPDVPDWLVAIIDRLHAKDPDQRYQSAAEVAELLGRHLAHVQHPSVVAPVANVSQDSAGRTPAPRRRLLAVAAAVLLGLVGVISLSEATGVTRLRSTVIRIFTPDGTLVVEVDDPGVKVTVEGDGGLVITGAGLEEIRLRPGSYQVHAEKDGKKILLDRELVSIAKQGREVVKVKLEAPPVPPIAKAEKGAFVLLAAGTERKFETLAEAVQRSSAGDTIEVRGDGPFISDGVSITHRLVIRAGEGSSPSITQSPASAAGNVPLLNISAPLVLEGLDLRRMGGGSKGVGEPFLLNGRGGGSLHFANCRLTFKVDRRGDVGWPFNVHVKSITLRNSLLSGNVDGTSWRYPAGGRCTIDNCVSAVGGLGFSNSDQDVRDVAIRVRGSTLVGNCLTLVTFGNLTLPDPAAATPPILLEFSGNVAWTATTHNRGFLYFSQGLADPFSVAEAEAFLPRLVSLHEKQNVYRTGTRMLQLAVGGKRGQDRTDWDRFWNQKNTGSVEGAIRFQGGDLVSRASTAPEKLTPDDFRLRPDSAGYRAGKDGKDLGADVDLVGPGPAYERWKKTPEYQQWRKDTGQVAKGDDAKPILLMHFDKADFYEKDGKTYIRDRSGNGNDGLCEKVRFTPQGKTGGGLANDGKGSLRLPSSLISGKPHFTIAGWVKPADLKKYWCLYTVMNANYRLGDPISEPRFILRRPQGTYLFASAWNSALKDSWIQATSGTLNDLPGEWLFVAAALEEGGPGKGRLRLMMNDRIWERPFQQIDGSSEGFQDIASLELEGVLDELVVWDRALSDQELQELFASGRAPAGKAPAAPTSVKAKSLDPDRNAAEYVLSIGGTVCVNAENRVLKAAAGLPPEPFRLTLVNLSLNKQVSDAGLAAFQDCKNLTHLYLGGTPVSNAGLAHFKDCKNLMALWLHHTQVSDAGLVHFKECNLISLHLSCTQVSDAGLAHFKDCKNLTQLGLEGTKVSNTGLEYFKDCKNLMHLVLPSTQVGDAGLAHFKDCKNLARLHLRGTQVSDAGLAYFQDCKNLTELYLGGTPVSNAGLAHFKECKGLLRLALDNTRVTDDGLGYFKNCKKLTELTLSETQVGDTGLKHLAGLKNLDSLDLRRTKASAAGVAELQKALPKCKIDWGDNPP